MGIQYPVIDANGDAVPQLDKVTPLIPVALYHSTASDQIIAMGATGATLTLAKLDELIDAVKGGKPYIL
ncbi:unnamed protein product, partial [marine sediment metagenome]